MQEQRSDRINIREGMGAEDFQKITNIAVEPSYTGYPFYETKAE